MKIMDKFMDFLGLGDPDQHDRYDDEASDFEDPDTAEQTNNRATKGSNGAQASNVVSIHSKKSVAPTQVVLSELRSYEEVQEVTNNLKSKKIVIVNLQRLHDETSMRAFDFLTGTVFAIGGSMSKVGQNIFICAPDTVELIGAISDSRSEFNDYPRMR